MDHVGHVRRLRAMYHTHATEGYTVGGLATLTREFTPTCQFAFFDTVSVSPRCISMKFVFAQGAVCRSRLCLIILVRQLSPQCLDPSAFVVVWLKATRSQTHLLCCFTHFSICPSFCLIAVVADIRDGNRSKTSCRHSCLHRTQSSSHAVAQPHEHSDVGQSANYPQ